MRRERAPRMAMEARPWGEAPDFEFEEIIAMALYEPQPLVDHEPPVMDIPINGVVVIPGLPNPHGGGVYRLQVGAYSGIGSVSMAMRQVESAGFNATQERYGNLFRVMVEGVPSWNVQAAVQRLAAVGFTQIWVKE